MEWLSDLQPQTQAALVSAIVSAVVALLLAIVNPFTQRRIERVKSELQEDLERTKADLAEEASSRNARRSYEFEVRKRLYTEIEPLLFQLFEAVEGSYYRAASLVRTHHHGSLGRTGSSWLTSESYYLHSTIYRLFLPLAIYRLIQRSATFVDLGLDESVRIRYFLLKLSYYVFTDDFVLARLHPALSYEPNRSDWRAIREEDPAVYWRQGFVIGHLDSLIDALTILEGSVRRPMTYGEFEEAILRNEAVQPAFGAPRDLLTGFSFTERPVLARILLGHAYFMRLLLLTYSRPVGVEELVASARAFMGSDEAKKDLMWWKEGDRSSSEPVLEYVIERLHWISPHDYAISGR